MASQYALGARERLAPAEGDERMEMLHTFAQDWAALRKGDQNAELITLERRRVVLAEQDSLKKFKRKVVIGLEAMLTHVERHPDAKAAFNAFVDQVRHPFDPTEQNLGKDRTDSDFDPTKSD